LGDRRLPRTVPASVRDVAKLLKCYGREFGWRLGRPELAKWAEAFDADGDGLVSASDVETFAQRSGGAWRGGPEEQKGPWRVSFDTGDAEATEFICLLRDALRSKQLDASDLERCFGDRFPKPKPKSFMSLTWSRPKSIEKPKKLALVKAVEAIVEPLSREDAGKVQRAAGRAFRAGAFAAERDEVIQTHGASHMIGEPPPRGGLIDTQAVCRAVRRSGLAPSGGNESSTTGDEKTDSKIRAVQGALRRWSRARVLAALRAADADNVGRVDASQFLSALDRLDVFPLDGGLAALQTSEVRKLFVFFDDSGEASSASVEELLEFLLDNAVQTHCHRFAAIVARAARAAQRSGAAADADLVREVAAYLRRHDKKRDGSCRQAALEKTLHWTGIIHELQPFEVEDLLGALKLEQVTRRGEPVVDYALFLRQVLGDDALQAYPERGVVNRGPGTSRKERPTTARRRRYDSEEDSEEEEPRRRRGGDPLKKLSTASRKLERSGSSLAEFLEEGAKRGQLTSRQFARCLEDVAQELDVDEVLSRREVDSILSDVGDGRRIRVEDLLQECGLDNYDENDDYPTTSKKYPRTPGLARTPARFRDDSDDDDEEPRTRRTSRKPTTAVKDRKLTEVQHRVRAALRQCKVRHGSSYDLNRAFDRLDRSGRGVVSSSDFDRVLSTLGVDRDDARKLRKRFDRFGSVDYADFCRFVEADVDGLRFAASKIADKLAEQQRKGLDVLLPFQMADSGDHGIVPARDFQDALRALDLGDLQDADRRELAAAFAPSGDPDAVDYREFLKFVRDAGGHMESTGPSATPRLVDASSKAYDGFYGGASSDDDDYRPRRRNPPRSPVTRQRRTLFRGDSAPETAWRA
jgi:Ca2+-binding EF-hand superfamily protein